MGRQLTSSCSFANATRLPANEIEPISAESMIETPTSALIRPGSGSTWWKSASATSAAAPPPTPLNSATICGIAVIFPLRAAPAPNGAETTITIRIDQPLWIPACAKVAPTATAIPTAPIRFPSGAVLGEERNRSARMKATIAARYATATASPLLISPPVGAAGASRSPRNPLHWSVGADRRFAPPLEHPQHPVGDDEAADDVHRPECDSGERDDPDPRRLVRQPRHHDRPDQDDPVDRVRPRHQRRVQHRRHLRDHLEPDEYRQDQHREPDDDQRGMHQAGAFARVTHAPAVISSSKSSCSSPSGARCWSSAATLRENSWLAWNGIVAGTFVNPTIVTPSRSTSEPGSVSSQLPPASAARSTITEPGRIPATAAAGIRVGAGRPGASAVVITTSYSGVPSAGRSCCSRCSSPVNSRA